MESALIVNGIEFTPHPEWGDTWTHGDIWLHRWDTREEDQRWQADYRPGGVFFMVVGSPAASAKGAIDDLVVKMQERLRDRTTELAHLWQAVQETEEKVEDLKAGLNILKKEDETLEG